MPRRLSDPEWISFLNDVDVTDLRMPPWGGVVQWGSQYILVYVCQTAGSLCQAGEVMLTDISDRADLIKNIPATYDQAQQMWWYWLPQMLMAQVLSVSQTALTATGQIVQAVAQQAGQAAGGLTGPLLQNLALPLIVIGIIYLVFESRR